MCTRNVSVTTVFVLRSCGGPCAHAGGEVREQLDHDRPRNRRLTWNVRAIPSLTRAWAAFSVLGEEREPAVRPPVPRPRPHRAGGRQSRRSAGSLP